MTATATATAGDLAALSAAEFSAGTEYPATTPPPGLEPGPPKQCYATAAACAIDHRYTYCEGYALHRRIGYWVHHAWNLTADGRAFDLTWPEPGSRYVGRPHATLDVLDRAAERGHYNAMAHVLPLLNPAALS